MTNLRIVVYKIFALQFGRGISILNAKGDRMGSAMIPVDNPIVVSYRQPIDGKRITTIVLEILILDKKGTFGR